MNITAYAKSIVYIALAAAAFVVTALADDLLTVEELVNLGIIVVGAIGVYWAPNVPDSILKYFKAVVAFAAAGLVALVSFLSDGVTLSEWLQVGIAALAGIGVTIVPNEPAVPLTQGADGVWRA